MGIEKLMWEVLTKVDVNEMNDEIEFTTINGKKYLMYHEQDCCEAVYIEDICGDVNVLIGAPITIAEEVTEYTTDDWGDSVTWTFYKLATVNGYVTIRWYGTSNGYYSESVDFIELE